MYTRFFGLNEKPFTITPDPRYLFMSERHGEGLAHLVYGVTESGGFIQLTGEVGTGKTTLVRTLLGQIPAEVDIALILNPQLTAIEFLASICEELGIPLPAEKQSSKALVDALNRHLLDAHARGRRTILLIDEAQNLADDVLEQLRLLTNLETAKQKLLQIILIAQPELREKLAKNNLRQLTQRVTGRYHLEPLSREEAGDYIDHRLRVAGSLTEIFDAGAKREVFRLSGGVPRIMNVICDRALLGAFSRESRLVNTKLVRKAAAEVSGQKLTPLLLKWGLPLLGVAAAAMLVAALWPSPDTIRPEVQPSITAPAEELAAGDGTIADAEEMPGGTVPTVAAADGHLLEEFLSRSGSGPGITTLLPLWGIAYDRSAGPACGQAEIHGLSCYYQRGSWNGMQQLDRPVVLTLTDDNGTNHEVVLSALRDDKAELSVGERKEWFSLSAVSERWFGQYMLVWRPPNGKPEAITPGSRNANVVWLRQSLAALEPGYVPQAPESDFFDAELAQQLTAFQRNHRLEADGVAGEKTQIIINSFLEIEGTPFLSANR